MAKTTKKDASKRVPFQWDKLLAMWRSGKSYLEMAKALDSHFDPNGDDPTKSIRAKCSVAMTKGVKIDGKLVRFARRDKAKKDTDQKKAEKLVKPPSKKVMKPTSKKGKSKASLKPTSVTPPEQSKPQPEA